MLTPLLYILTGIAVGVLIGWLLRAPRQPQSSDNRLETELRQQLAVRESELAENRQKLAEAASSRASAEANQAAAEKLLTEQRQIHEQTLREAKESQEKALADLRDTFKALSAD